jgi:hypothetical protein
MGFIFFKQSKAKKFGYIPRFYDPVKEEREKRRAALGLNDVTDNDDLRSRMRARWRKQIPVEKGPKYTPLSMIIYAVVIIGGIYIIFFTRLIDNMIRAFGLIN